MHHLFLGIDPHALGVSPFTPAVHRSLDIKARDLGLAAHPAANVHILPTEAVFVGAENVGVLIAEEPYRRDEMVLIIDVGTNGEMILGNREKLLSASCATGPALEGAHIRFGNATGEGASIAAKEFQEELMAAMFIPHMSDAFPHLPPPGGNR